TASATVNVCVSLSTEQGPAISTSWGLPMAQRPTDSTVLRGWKTRLTSLKGTGIGSTACTVGPPRTRSQSTGAPSPTRPPRAGPPGAFVVVAGHGEAEHARARGHAAHRRLGRALLEDHQHARLF